MKQTHGASWCVAGKHHIMALPRQRQHRGFRRAWSQETWLGPAGPTDTWLSVTCRHRKQEVRSERTKAETSPTGSKALPIKRRDGVS